MRSTTYYLPTSLSSYVYTCMERSGELDYLLSSANPPHRGDPSLVFLRLGTSESTCSTVARSRPVASCSALVCTYVLTYLLTYLPSARVTIRSCLASIDKLTYDHRLPPPPPPPLGRLGGPHASTPACRTSMANGPEASCEKAVARQVIIKPYDIFHEVEYLHTQIDQI
ncbi:hypothetical protein GGR51DRAFT_529853, partial [Nemania sp. FL0031]